MYQLHVNNYDFDTVQLCGIYKESGVYILSKRRVISSHIETDIYGPAHAECILPVTR